MARIEALNILTEEEGKEYLAELYGKVIDGVQKNTVSAAIKNTDLSGDPTAGSVEAKRFVNAESQKYGSARTNGKGSAVKATAVTVAIDTDKEIVEELEAKDISLYGVDGILDRRAQNHVLRMAAELDRAFFDIGYKAATKVTVDTSGEAEDVLEEVIQKCETVKNKYVDGVPRDLMHLVLSPKWYGKIRNAIDKASRVNVDTTTEEFNVWHGVEVRSSTRLPEGCAIMLMVKGSVAQPVVPRQYVAEKIPLSQAYGVELFYSYGTKAVMPDLIFAVDGE